MSKRAIEDDFCDDVFADNLSDVPSDYSECDSDGSESDFESEQDSESDIDSDCYFSFPTDKNKKHSQIVDENDNEWTTQDPQRILEPFAGTAGITFSPNDPSSVMEMVERFLGHEFISLMVFQSNLYHAQNSFRFKTYSKTAKWQEISDDEMKKFLGIIILMGHVKKERVRDYWSTDSLIETPIFGKIMSRNRWEQIWRYWHFSDNEADGIDKDDRLYKVQPVLQYFSDKFTKLYKPEQQISLDEAMVPWQGRLKIKVFNPRKPTKYGMLVRVVCEATSGYICSLEVYSSDGKKLSETVLSVLHNYLNLQHHVYQDNYYNSVKITETLLQQGTRVCGTIRANRGVPKSLNAESKKLKTGECAFLRKDEVLIHAWNDKREVKMVSSIHNATMDWTTNRRGEKVKKPASVIGYNKYMKGVDRADQYLSYYSILRKSVKWTKKLVLWLINCALFNAFRLYQFVNTGSKMKYKKFLLTIAGHLTGIKPEQNLQEQDVELASISNDQIDGLNQLNVTAQTSKPKTTTRRKQNPQNDYEERLSGGLKVHTLQPITGIGIKKYPQKPCKVCAAHKQRKDTRYIYGFCDVPLHKGSCFEKYHSLKKY